MSRSFLFVSSFDRDAARQAVVESELEVDIAVISPTDRAREAASYAVGGRWLAVEEEPLLASRATAESGADVIARFAQAIRNIAGLNAQAPLVVLDGLDLLGAATFALDEKGLLRFADDLERMLPLP